MRLYTTLAEAASEIQRDLKNGQTISGTRVQQRRGKFTFNERLGYDYAISENESAWPETPGDLVNLGISLGFETFKKYHAEYAIWLDREIEARTRGNFGNPDMLTEPFHPALISTIEGNWPSYTYTERLSGAIPALVNALISAPDTRRAFWPIFRPEDALRASAPTRVPCSLGYQVLIRPTTLGPRMYLVYLERSADFDHFWLTDIWLARQFQKAVLQAAQHAGVMYEGRQPTIGPVIHQLISFHSFEVAGTEVY